MRCILVANKEAGKAELQVSWGTTLKDHLSSDPLSPRVRPDLLKAVPPSETAPAAEDQVFKGVSLWGWSGTHFTSMLAPSAKILLLQVSLHFCSLWGASSQMSRLHNTHLSMSRGHDHPQSLPPYPGEITHHL